MAISEADDIREAALAYARRGWSVVPMAPHGKRPLVSWVEFQERRADAAEIEAFFEHWPGANVGIVTGRISGIIVLDIDPRHGGDIAIANLERLGADFPVTVEARTGGGGRHLFFRHPGYVLHNRVGFEAGVDIRGDGGVIVVPPSIHASGRRYEWRSGRSPDDIAPARLPGWLERRLHPDGGQSGHSREYWRSLVRDGVSEGVRNNTVASLAGHLLWRGVDPDVVTELLLCWNRVRARPPLPDNEVVRTVLSIAALHRRRPGGS